MAFEFTWLEFGSGVAETAIGAALGFGLGLVAFRVQHKHQRLAENERQREISIDALNRLLQCAVLNIEALAGAKMQYMSGLGADTQQNIVALKAFHDSRLIPTMDSVRELRAISETQLAFYQSLPEITVMMAPDFREYSMFSHDMPALTIFAHRAMASLSDLNVRLGERNNLLSQHSAENTVAGLNASRFLFFCEMLTDLSIYIRDSIDNALEFFSLVMEQIEAFKSASTSQGRFISYELLENVREVMPPKDLFPMLRAQLVRFEGRSPRAPIPRPPLGY